MNKIETGIEGLYIIEPKVFGDERGFFMETFNAKIFKSLGLPVDYVQDNFSRSSRGVLRGLHFQKHPHAQAKLVRVANGSVWDVVVDIREGSRTFGQHYGLELSAENKRALFIPEGFAHGFCVLSDTADFSYKCTELYTPASEGGIRWDDPELDIPWPITNPVVSPKDENLGPFRDIVKKAQFQFSQSSSSPL